MRLAEPQEGNMFSLASQSKLAVNGWNIDGSSSVLAWPPFGPAVHKTGTPVWVWVSLCICPRARFAGVACWQKGCPADW